MKFFSTLAAATLGTLIGVTIFFFFGFLFLIGLAATTSDTPRVRDGSVLVMDLDGTIPERVSGDPFAQSLTGEPEMGLWEVKRAIENASTDDRIKALWLRIRGSSIPWVVAGDIREALVGFEETGKPVIASSDDFPISEDEYYLASVADQVYAGPESFFEFNGFYIGAEFYKRLLDKLDVEPQIVRAGDFKSAVESFSRESLSAENELQLQAILSTQERSFIQTVSTARKRSPEEMERLLDSFGIASATDAMEAGLLDGVKHRDEVEAELKSLIDVDPGDELKTIALSVYQRVRPAGGSRPSGRNDVAVVYAKGTIVSGRSNASGSRVGAETFARAMKRVRESDRVKAVVVRIDSPGGSASASDAMLRAIAKTREEKPVVVSMGGLAASGGYWIAMESDSIIASPLTLTGSIGVYSLFLDVGGLYEDKIGITFDVLRTGPYADMLSGLRPFNDAEIAMMQSSVDQTYQAFLSKVALNRNLPIERVNELAQGRVWTGADALEVGLVDALGGIDDAVKAAAGRADLDEGDYRVRMFPMPLTLAERFRQSLGAQVAAFLPWNPVSEFDRKALEHIREVGAILEDVGTVQARLPYVIRLDR